MKLRVIVCIRVSLFWAFNFLRPISCFLFPKLINTHIRKLKKRLLIGPPRGYRVKKKFKIKKKKKQAEAEVVPSSSSVKFKFLKFS